LIEVFPVILRHETKGTEQRKAEVVEACVSVVGVRSDSETCVIGWTRPVNVYDVALMTISVENTDKKTQCARLQSFKYECILARDKLTLYTLLYLTL